MLTNDVMGDKSPSIRQKSSTATAMATARTMEYGNHRRENYEEVAVVGGGSINEKKRYFGLERKHPPGEELEEEVGQGESNKSNFDPQSETAHLLHALVGLERYPNYISRWSYNLVQDVEKLECALEEQLQKVREQKERLLVRSSNIQKNVKEAQKADLDDDSGMGIDEDDWNILSPPNTWEEVKDNILDSKCADAIFQSKMFRHKDRRPSLDDVLSGNIVVELDASQCEEWLDQEMYDVYSFPLLAPSFCTKLKRVMKRLIQYQLQLQEEEEAKATQPNSDVGTRPNTDFLGSRPVDLDVIGLPWINNLLFHLIIRPLSRHLFQNTETMDDLDWRHGYIVGYNANPNPKGVEGTQRQRLVPHTDDSEVTLNIGMGDDFEGGDLAFWGLRNSKDEGNFVGQFHPVIGTALLHAGRHLHEVKEVTGGNRYAYILWARSWKGVRSKTCPCCWLSRRQQSSTSNRSYRNSCICGATWN